MWPEFYQGTHELDEMCPECKPKTQSQIFLIIVLTSISSSLDKGSVCTFVHSLSRIAELALVT